jgi:aspartyl-tRNA(Asn)/glutamyl-tRNA(Gln) amidotransferase subunit A
MLVQESLERAHKDEFNAVVTINEFAQKQAQELSSKGVEPFPFAVKDVIYTKGIRTTMGSRLFQDFVPSFDATVVATLKRAGGVLIGKTNTHELASGATTTSSIFGPTKNPLDASRIAGGSSGGSAAAVSSGIVEFALGTDTAGSVRIPAALCGVYGLKPTNGLLSNKGVFPLAPTFDTVGFISSDLNWLKRLKKLLPAFSKLSSTPRKPKIAVPSWVYWWDKAPASYSKTVEEVVLSFEKLLDARSIEWSKVEMPLAEALVWSRFGAIRYAEATHVHLERKQRWSECFPDVRRLLERGLTVLATEYLDALFARKRVYSEFKRVITQFDVLATPTVSIPAPKIEEVLGNEDGDVRSVLTHNTVYASYIGVPALSIPTLKVEGLPVGVQLIADKFDELKLLEIASLF